MSKQYNRCFTRTVRSKKNISVTALRGDEYEKKKKKETIIHCIIIITGTAFTVEWTKVVLQDKPNAGAFTFQATLHENGNIVFVYAQMPLSVEAIEDKEHPVKVGLSDAYIMDRSVFRK